MSEGDAPLILTAELPPELHRRFTDLRTQYFPPERNYLEAHVTLFHALPAQCEDEARRYLARLVGEVPPIEGRVEGLMSLGGGTAIKLSSPDLLALRDEIAEHFRGMLTKQDPAVKGDLPAPEGDATPDLAQDIGEPAKGE